MFADKKRLYVAAYPSGVNGARKYDWALLVGPKAETGPTPGTRYHATQTNDDKGWSVAAESLPDVRCGVHLLARFVVAKVRDERRLVRLLQRTPAPEREHWVAAVLDALKDDDKAVGTAELDWAGLQGFATQYIGSKSRDGRYTKDLLLPKPTWDLLEKREVVP